MKNNLRNSSWIDLFFLWIDSLPVAIWVFYIILFLVIMLINFVLAGSALDMTDAFYNVFSLVILLLANHMVFREAFSSFDKFAPSLNQGKDQIAQVRWKFTLTPAWIGWLVLLIGISFIAFFFAESQEDLLSTGISPWRLIVVGVINFVPFASLMVYLIITTIRRLRFITLLHRQIKSLDLFDLDSVRAFSRFSSISAISLLVIVFANLRFYLNSTDPIADLIFISGIIVLSLLVFLLPLYGLRNRIAGEKEMRINQKLKDIEFAGGLISTALRENNYKNIDSIKQGMDAIVIERDEIRKVQPWPWSSAAIRGLSSAMVIPLLLWIITRILERFI